MSEMKAYSVVLVFSDNIRTSFSVVAANDALAIAEAAATTGRDGIAKGQVVDATVHEIPVEFMRAAIAYIEGERPSAPVISLVPKHTEAAHSGDLGDGGSPLPEPAA